MIATRVNMPAFDLPFAAFIVRITLSMKDSEQYRDGITSWMAPHFLLFSRK